MLKRILLWGVLLLAPATAYGQGSSFGFAPQQTTQTISASTVSSSITLPSTPGDTIFVANTGSNTAYIRNSATATTGTGFPLPAGANVFLNYPHGSVVSAITASSTTTLLIVKGTGASAIGGGGSGGGGGGGAVTIADGADVTQGALADAACASDNATCSVIAYLSRIAGRLTTVNASINGSIPAASSNDTVIGSVGAYNYGGKYETIAASQTGQTMGPTGATGDYLSHCTVYPTSTSPGVLTVFDSTSSTTNNVITFPGGSSSLSNLAPFTIPVGAFSLNGAWKVTTGANMLAICYGKFT